MPASVALEVPHRVQIYSTTRGKLYHMNGHTAPRSAGVAIRHNLADMAQACSRRYYATYHRSAAPSPEYRAKSERDVAYHLGYLCDSLWAEDQELFAGYVCWAAELFASMGFSPSMLPDLLDAMQSELNQRLSPAQVEAVNGYFVAAHGALAQRVATPSYLDENNPHHELASVYLEALLDGRRHDATQIILDAVRAGARVDEIYLNVFQQTQAEIGRLWQMNRITVAQEHYVTAATQFAMAQLYPYIFSTRRRGARLVAASVGDELHELGIRMVADFFEMAGWDTYYIGASTPTRDLVAAVTAHRPNVVALSATLTTHLMRVSEVIDALHKIPDRPAILVGGYPFNVSPELWRRLGADGTATDARSAVQLAESSLA